ncbi:hypothetical protein P186_2078 [Pyrobaculum ferrireducens]|uniref:PaREP6 n=1 Tax=Pyrobaculum ferrireducens TaxID=1104324 RepID=G7VIJ2_9CREN|nr:hypothetical protein P186_2078 [Pyrobaculum ferrireducens]
MAEETKLIRRRAFQYVEIEEILAREAEAREMRRREANWDFINSLPPRLRAALVYYIETGDLYVASRIAGMKMEEFNELRIRANIPHVN